MKVYLSNDSKQEAALIWDSKRDPNAAVFTSNKSCEVMTLLPGELYNMLQSNVVKQIKGYMDEDRVNQISIEFSIVYQNDLTAVISVFEKSKTFDGNDDVVTSENIGIMIVEK